MSSGSPFAFSATGGTAGLAREEESEHTEQQQPAEIPDALRHLAEMIQSESQSLLGKTQELYSRFLVDSAALDQCVPHISSLARRRPSRTRPATVTARLPPQDDQGRAAPV